MGDLRVATLLVLAVAASVCGGCGDSRESAPAPSPAPVVEETPEVIETPPEGIGAPTPTPARSPIAIDTHVDTTQRMLDAHADIGERLGGGHLDLPRMREGGLSGAFFSIWVDPRDHEGEAAWRRALALIAAVHEVAERHPDQAVVCTSADEVRRANAANKIALLLGVEGAHALGAPESDEALLARLTELHGLGVRYMTVTWSNDNALAHSSGGAHRGRGLTELGRRAIREMNRLGIVVDVSHVSDRTFWDIVEIAERPLLASHSSCRALSDHARNMTDPMIRAVGERGGAVCINYYTQFLDAEYGARRRALEEEHADRFRAVRRAHPDSWDRWQPANALARSLDPELSVPTLETLGAHFAHVVEIAGPGAACLGSDFDGVGELPLGMEDVADLGALSAELERRGLPVPAIFGENVLRVLAAQTP